MATASKSLSEDLALNLVDRLSADYSDLCWTLTSGRSGCPWGGVKAVPYTLGLCHSWSQQSAASNFQFWCSASLLQNPEWSTLRREILCVPETLCPLVAEEEQVLGALCAATGAMADTSDALIQMQTQSRSPSLVSASYCLGVPTGKQFFLESGLISSLLCILLAFKPSPPKPCQPYKPREPWWPWNTCLPFKAFRSMFSSCVIPKASSSACWYLHAAQVLSYRGRPKVGFSKAFSSEHSWDLTGETPGAQPVPPF